MFGLCIELYGRVNLRLNHRAAIDFVDSLAALGIAQASYGKSQIFYVKRYKFDYYLVIS